MPNGIYLLLTMLVLVLATELYDYFAVVEATIAVVQQLLQLLQMKLLAGSGTTAGNDDDDDLAKRCLLPFLSLPLSLLLLPLLYPLTYC